MQSSQQLTSVTLRKEIKALPLRIQIHTLITCSLCLQSTLCCESEFVLPKNCLLILSSSLRLCKTVPESVFRVSVLIKCSIFFFIGQHRMNYMGKECDALQNILSWFYKGLDDCL